MNNSEQNTTTVYHISDIENTIVFCPHCRDPILIEKMNCGIFRHASYISNHQPIDPHLSKEACDRLVLNKEVYGCAKPFKIEKRDDYFELSICGYI